MMPMKIAQKNKTLRRPFVIALIAIALIAASFAATLLYMNTSTPPVATNQAQKDVIPKVEKPKSLTLPGAKTPIPLPIEPAFLARPDGQLILINRATPNELTYEPTDLVLPSVPYRTDKSKEEMMVRAVLTKPLEKMFAAAKTEGVDLVIASAYRSSKLQETYYNSYVRASGREEAEKYIALPGTSEHQSGLAVDFTTPDLACYLVECFESTAAGTWLATHAHSYGFILRYPKNKVDVTHYSYEPWHFRYLGVAVATAVYESGLAYEEAFPYLSGEKKP